MPLDCIFGILALNKLKLGGSQSTHSTKLMHAFTHVTDDAAGADVVVVPQPALVLGILSGAQHVLVAHVVRPLIDDPESTLHTDGVAVVEVPVQVTEVIVALVVATQEVLVLVEDDLDRQQKVKQQCEGQRCKNMSAT